MWFQGILWRDFPVNATYISIQGPEFVNPITQLTDELRQRPGVLVTVDATQGSVPREQGAWMAVFDGKVINTIGGGHLELQAIQHARAWLAGKAGEARVRFALGPALGQCCGGVVHLCFESISGSDLALLPRRLTAGAQPVALFGGGHVGKALVQVLGRLPFEVCWIDSRDEIFPADLPDNVSCEHSDPVQSAVSDLVPGSLVLIMSFSHAEDLDVVAACLKRLRTRDDLPYVGLIGSKTKWATFCNRLRERGFSTDELARITCPIGVPGIAGKEPDVIAVGVAAQLLQTADAIRLKNPPKNHLL